MKGCRSCNHWQNQEVDVDRIDPATANQKVQLGICRRYAPRPGMASGPKGAGDSDSSPWPQVASDDWCGEWEPDFH